MKQRRLEANLNSGVLSPWWPTSWFLQVGARAGEELRRRVGDGDASARNGQREGDPVELNSGELLLVAGWKETGRGRRRSCLNGMRETER